MKRVGWATAGEAASMWAGSLGHGAVSRVGFRGTLPPPGSRKRWGWRVRAWIARNVLRLAVMEVL